LEIFADVAATFQWMDMSRQVMTFFIKTKGIAMTNRTFAYIIKVKKEYINKNKNISQMFQK